MADYIYDKGRSHILDGDVAWSSNNQKLALIDTVTAPGYTASQASDEFLSVIDSGLRVALSANLGSKTSIAGVADAADVTLTSVSGAVCQLIVIYHDSGAAGTSHLVCKMDSYNGLPVTPNGGNIQISFPNDGNKIFKL